MGAPCIFFLILLLAGIALLSPVLSFLMAAIAIVFRNAIATRRDRKRADEKIEVAAPVVVYFVPTG